MKAQPFLFTCLSALLLTVAACGLDPAPTGSQETPTSDPHPDVPVTPDAHVGDSPGPDPGSDGGIAPGGNERFAQVGFSTLGAGTTGGQAGPTVSVATLAELQQAAGASGPAIIEITAPISGNTSVIVTSDKTVVGIGTAGQLVGVGLRLKANTHNVIMRNLSISKVVASAGDAIAIQGPGTDHVWVDHCDLSSDLAHGKDFYDGLLDITHAADAVTVSWNVFHDHFKVSLVGHSDNNGAEDTGKLHVTYHHNRFQNVSSRAPSLRFGTLHAFNNLSEDFVDASTGVSSRDGACARVEHDVFAGVATPVLVDQSDVLGQVQLIDNDVTGAGPFASTPPCQLDVPYAFEQILDAAADVAVNVAAGAGVGKLADPTQF